MLCLGKNPARPNAAKFKFNEFLAGTKPIYPPDFGHEEQTPPIAWQMCANDKWGVCVEASGAHETKLWCRMGGKPEPQFTDTDIAEDYTAITGQQPGPDNGTDMQAAASYRRKVGLRDSTGARHKIGAYLEVQAGNLTELCTAIYLFGAVGIGVAIYSSAMDDFLNHRAWGYSANGGSFEGYHAIPCVALRGNIVVVSWGRFQAMRPSFFVQNCDEVLAYVSEEALIDGRSPEGFDYATLNAKLAALE